MKEIFWISHSPIHQEEYQDLCQRSGAPLLIRPMEPESLEEQLQLRGSRVESLVFNLPLPKAAQVFRTAAGRFPVLFRASQRIATGRKVPGYCSGLPEDEYEKRFVGWRRLLRCDVEELPAAQLSLPPASGRVFLWLSRHQLSQPALDALQADCGPVTVLQYPLPIRDVADLLPLLPMADLVGAVLPPQMLSQLKLLLGDTPLLRSDFSPQDGFHRWQTLLSCSVEYELLPQLVPEQLHTA